MIKSINAKAKRHKGGDNDGWTPMTGIVSRRLDSHNWYRERKADDTIYGVRNNKGKLI